jgi:hypothetical protein
MHDHAKVFHDVLAHAYAARVHIKHGYVMYADAVNRYNTKTGFRAQANSNITVGSLLKRLGQQANCCYRHNSDVPTVNVVAVVLKPV